MRESVRRDFGGRTARAIVLDDEIGVRSLTAQNLRGRGYEVVECANWSEFHEAWRPGMFDVIISDWNLSHAKAEDGDRVLEDVRKRDWDVPFVLVSGKLGDAEEKAQVLNGLLQSGSARFVERGDGAIELVCNAAEDLLERRDLALLKVVLALRTDVLAGVQVTTSSGRLSPAAALARVVSRPEESHASERPVADAQAKRKLDGK